MEAVDPSTIHDQVREIARRLPIWLDLLRFASIAVAALLAVWITIGRSHLFVQAIVLAAGIMFVIWLNVEVHTFAGELDLLGMLAFVPLLYAVYRLWTRGRTGF